MGEGVRTQAQKKRMNLRNCTEESEKERNGMVNVQINLDERLIQHFIT